MSYIGRFLCRMFPYALLYTALYLPLRVIFLRKRRERFSFREIGLYLFYLMLVCVVSQTVLESLPTASFEEIRRKSDGERVNFIPGKIFRFASGSLYVTVIGLLGNLFILLPLGFGYPLLFPKENLRKTVLQTVLFVFLLSLSFELLQIPLDRGSDVDDLWLNTLGGIFGAFLSLPIPRFFPKFAAALRGKT